METCPQCSSVWCLDQGGDFCHRNGKLRQVSSALPEVGMGALAEPPVDKMIKGAVNKATRERPRKARR